MDFQNTIKHFKYEQKPLLTVCTMYIIIGSQQHYTCAINTQEEERKQGLFVFLSLLDPQVGRLFSHIISLIKLCHNAITRWYPDCFSITCLLKELLFHVFLFLSHTLFQTSPTLNQKHHWGCYLRTHKTKMSTFIFDNIFLKNTFIDFQLKFIKNL